MNIVTKTRRGIYTLMAAAAIVTALVAMPILLDNLAETNIVAPAYAGELEETIGGG